MTSEAQPEISFDELRERYQNERQKRLRAEGNGQYFYPGESRLDAERFLADPWADPRDYDRAPVTENVEVTLIGAGLGGLQVAVAMRDLGVDSMRILDKAGDFGGVWYWNRYPGVQCDVDAYIYLPLLERTGYVPTHKYASGNEIRAYVQRLAEQFDLYKDALFKTSVTGARWLDEEDAWLISTDRGDQIHSRFLVVCPGGLQQPKLPGIPGIESFEGRAFHASRWDYTYTGGAEGGEMTPLADKSVGVIGTGTTALQCVPRLGASARQLYVFQRTPTTVYWRGQQPTDPEWAASLSPGWQLERQRNFVAATSGRLPPVDLVDDGWTHLARNMSFTSFAENPHAASEDPFTLAEKEDFRVMEMVRKRIEEAVGDPELAEHLKPYYRLFCKRPGFNDEYLPTFLRPNVTLVDTNGRGPDKISEHAVHFDGVSYEVDCLVFCTGYDTGNGYLHGKGFDLTGRNGVRLSEYWQNGMRTFQGVLSRGFPNCMFMGSTQTSISLNYSHCLFEQAQHVAYLIQEGRARGARVIEPSEEAEDDWVEQIHAGWTPDRKRFALECTPSFFNNEGKPLDPNGHIYNYAGADPLSFFESLEAWRNEGNLEGLELKGREA
jgi:cation diffusion facilitator CzcD-associated flavoprotein CzcO